MIQKYLFNTIQFVHFIKYTHFKNFVLRWFVLAFSLTNKKKKRNVVSIERQNNIIFQEEKCQGKCAMNGR